MTQLTCNAQTTEWHNERGGVFHFGGLATIRPSEFKDPLTGHGFNSGNARWVAAALILLLACHIIRAK